jgi:SpoVK/Ycf46/Vps4 family AAA+-type ATPase
VELHASHFVAHGLPNVQRTADRIFRELMQLDRTVILFDEIDELVRAREKDSDAFGRFLTTSMLPKLAELWKGRRVIYFVATNHIKFFDPAIRRAERFDTLVDVSPPSFEKKIKQLGGLLDNDFRKQRWN